jgi:Transglutaminase-like enzymes, putative cysteine proteases
MGSGKKSAKYQKKRSGRLWVAGAVLVLIVLAATAAFILYPRNSPSTDAEVPDGLKTLAAEYMDIMKNLNSSQTRTEMAAKLNSNLNQTDLFVWEHSKMTFASDQTGWYTDPTEILSRGTGICTQWSIVYVSACLALNYTSRLVVAVDTSSWQFIHVWAEDYYGGRWVHVDPSDSVWNNPSRYQSWDWGSGIGTTVRVYAFEDNAYYDVTSSYA